MVNQHDPADAELSLLAVALASPQITTVVRLREADFYAPLRGEVWDAIAALHQEGVGPDVVTITRHLNLEAHRAQSVAEMLVHAATFPAIPGNAEHYAQVVTQAAERRRLAELLTRTQQRIADDTIPVDTVLAEVSRDLLRSSEMEQVVEDAQTLDEFVDQQFGPVDWIVPDLLARDDRLVITGIEGFGKSMLMRQVAVAVACGLHPFNLKPIPPKRVLYVDCENPKRIMADKFGAIRRVAEVRHTHAHDRLWIKRFPGGLDLADAKDRLDLHHLCQTLQPDLLCIGPVYKLYIGGSQAREEDLARTVTSALDRLRSTFGFALILEHHSPHAQPGSAHRSVRPIGSSLWLRWSEFGWGIAPAEGTQIEDRHAVVRNWRGARDERPWPVQLMAGSPNELPWIDPNQLQRSY